MIRTLFFSLILLASFCQSVHAADLNAWSPQAEEHPTTQAMQGFLAQFKAIDNRFEPKLLPAAAAGDQNKLLKSLKTGEIGVAVLTASTVSRAVPQAKVFDLPFLFRDNKQMFVQLDGDVGKDIEQALAAKGMVVLGWYDGGTRSLYMRNKPPRSVAELNGLKIRIPNRTELRTMVSSLGGQPEVMPYQDVNGAFDSGSIDGAENDLLSYEADQHYKHARYFVQSNHAVQYEALVVSTVVWDQLSDAARKSVMEAGRASALNDRDIWSKRLAAARTRLEKDGVKFIEPRDNSLFFSRVADSYKRYMDNPTTSGLLLRLMTQRG